MNTTQAIITNLAHADFLAHSYTADLTAQDLLARPVPGINHIAWQWGHLIGNDRYFLEIISPGKMPALPEGFAEKHGKNNAASDKPSDFLTKDEYARLGKQVREATIAVINSLSPADLDRPVTKVPPFLKTAGDTLLFLSTHWTMHTGQWAVTRRKLGRPPLF